MKPHNMTFDEALDAMKYGYNTRREHWATNRFLCMTGRRIQKDGVIDATVLFIEDITASDWEIYGDPEPEPQFEIGELVMMRAHGGMWQPKFFSYKTDNEKYPYRPISEESVMYQECAKFDKDIVFTNKPAK